MATAWTRSYACGHRARITKRYTSTFLLEIFTMTGDSLLRLSLLMPTLESAQQTADAVVSAQSDPWVPVKRGTFEADVAELLAIDQLSAG